MNIFSYESKPMQILMFVGDLIILNVVFLACCLPIFTIGAAQAGLYTAMRQLLNKDDDTSAVAAFFRGFKSGFGRVTLAWGLLFLLEAFLMFVLKNVMAFDELIGGAPVICTVVALCVVCLFQAIVTLFHSRFECTAFQLYRNAWFMIFAHPLRSVFTGLLVFAPVIVFFGFGIYNFMAATPLWGTIYFSTAFMFVNTVTNKPFQVLIDHFNEQNGIQPETPAEGMDNE